MLMIAYCGGTFDLVHAGHVWLFEQTKKAFGTVVVSLNNDSFVERYKGSRPVMTFEERYAVLKGLRAVDFVVRNIGDEDSKPAIEVVHPDMIVNGSDWTEEKLMKQMSLTWEFLHDRCITIEIMPSHPLHSSDLKKRMK